ncbi:MAG: N-acetylneuraminate synthase [Actinobacteria bacterium]|nr:MAG: N-acetylneuraminate synthase [Actinomycetota bacterium]
MAPVSRHFRIGGVDIHDGSECYVVAEIGHNHQGDVEKAKQLIRSAAEWGVDAVKLQKRANRTLYTRDFFDQPYDNEFSFGRTYGEHREALELDADEYRELQRYAREVGITLFATAFDFESADLLAELDVPAFKFASGDLRNTPLQRHVAAFGKPMFLSTGGGTMQDVERAVDAILPLNDQLCILQCTAAYPAEAEDLNLNVISALRERFPDLVIGLSDHQNGIAMALVAYMLGARVIEKHFTLDHALKGTDHAFSLMPDGMRRLVRDLHRIPAALGDGVKRPLPVETKPLEKMGKKLVAARGLEAGHMLAADDLAIKSPADGGLPPYELDRIVGMRLLRPLRPDENVELADLEPVAEPAGAEAVSRP